MPLLVGSTLYYEERGAKYYGIPVPRGTRMTEGAVADTCEAAGMRAVCAGDSNCRYSSSRCEVVHFETKHCGYTMYGLAKKVCGENTAAEDCPRMDGLFSYLKGWEGGECGLFSGQKMPKGLYCVRGNSFTSGNPVPFYAYCVRKSNY